MHITVEPIEFPDDFQRRHGFTHRMTCRFSDGRSFCACYRGEHAAMRATLTWSR